MATSLRTAAEVPTGLSLEQLRKWAGFPTQRPTAVLLDISQPRLDQIENDGCERLTLLKKMADLYCVTFDVVDAANECTKNDKKSLSTA